jgi:hypothetical protein
LWAAEKFFVQASLFESPPITRHPLCFRAARLGFDLAISALILLTLSRPWLLLIAAVDFLISLALVAQNHYFHRTCSLRHIARNFREGLKASTYAFRIIPPAAWAGLAGALAVKVILILRLAPEPLRFQHRTWVISLLVAAVLAGLLALQLTSFRFSSIQRNSITRCVYAYGYLISWFADLIFAPSPKDLVHEVAQLQEISPDRLADTEPPWPVGDKIVIVQLESVGWNALDLRINGQEVMPCLDQLAYSSRLFKIQAYHSIGTADMDYAVLSGGTPSDHTIGYYVPGLAYPRALPRFMQEQGFRTVALHGVTGEFYNRRSNFKRMGFDELLFSEEFHGRPVRRSYWGVRDEELLRFSAQKLKQATRREFHFIITLDTHGQFDLIGEEEKEIFPDSRIWQQDYFNSLRVLDRNLRHYIESLPTGALVILYGDHTAGVNYGEFQSARYGSIEYVPCIVHVCQTPATWVPEPARQAPLPYDLRILDIMNFLRGQIIARGKWNNGRRFVGPRHDGSEALRRSSPAPG